MSAVLSSPAPAGPRSPAGQAWALFVKIAGIALVGVIVLIAVVVSMKPASATDPQPSPSVPAPQPTQLVLKVGQDATMTRPGQKLWVSDDPVVLGRMFADVGNGAQVSESAALVQYGLLPMPENTRVHVLELSTFSGYKLARIQLIENPQVMVQTWTVAEWLKPTP